MWSFLVVLSCIFTVVSLNPVTAPVGGNATFRYHFLASVNIKYFCRDSCEDEFILIRSNKKQNPTRTDRFTLYDEGSDFTVTITRLQLSDSGTYICAVDRLIKDTYKHVTLHVYEVSISTPVPSSASSPSARTTRNTIENNGKSVTMQSSADTSPETMHGSALSAVVVGAADTVTGHRGERVEIRCSYESGYESNSKYFCKGECIIGFKNIMVKSGSAAKDERFSLTDDTTNRVFTVTITDLRTEDEGQYWCAVKRTLSLTDVYSEILLQIKQDKKTTEVSTISPFSKTSSSYFSTTELNPQSGSVIYVCVGLVIMVIVFLIALTVLCKQKKSKNLPKVTQLGLPQHVSVGLLPLNTTAENTAEDIDWNDHNYQETSEFQCKNKDISTIYTTAESPDDSHIYSTADALDDSNKPDYSTIYSTADNPEDSTIYSITDKPDDFTIYSNADKPDSTVYSTVDKPVSTIYSKAESR
ncbi:CMRF35-like molecule 8 isoform X1 [Ctenopharyngodon idella]|uniref:CMRF35-like molecule 8 isoform X1 n=1 Tax=Ctenopharyngodon idella TaxID=7959 RepID=UPI00222E3A90|nr:CMRF35-like molecule 8 isoform X1 [Ctenopharyngodon idella]